MKTARRRTPPHSPPGGARLPVATAKHAAVPPLRGQQPAAGVAAQRERRRAAVDGRMNAVGFGRGMRRKDDDTAGRGIVSWTRSVFNPWGGQRWMSLSGGSRRSLS